MKVHSITYPAHSVIEFDTAEEIEGFITMAELSGQNLHISLSCACKPPYWVDKKGWDCENTVRLSDWRERGRPIRCGNGGPIGIYLYSGRTVEDFLSGK